MGGDDMELICEYKKSIFTTEQGGTCIGLYQADKQDIVITGVMLPTIKHVKYKFEGTWTNHPKYGKQFKAELYQEDINDKNSIIAYLSSGIIKGIGLKTAEKIVAKFGNDTLYVMDNNIEELRTVKGISKKVYEKISTSYQQAKASREAILLLGKYGISPKVALKAFELFKDETLDIIKTQPYRLSSVRGIKFPVADAIGSKTLEYEMDYERFKACARYVLYNNENNEHQSIIGRRTSGSLGMNKDDFGKVMLSLLRINSIDGSFILNNTIRMLKEGELVKKNVENNEMYLYLPGIYRIECETAKHIGRLTKKNDFMNFNIEKCIKEAEQKLGITVCEEQKAAVRNAYNHNLSLVIGPPGSGKTTFLNIISYINEKETKKEIIFLAPSGKAASCIKETTHHFATTVHSGLEIGTEIINDIEVEEIKFSDKLIIVDEMSMLDARTSYRLFSSIDSSCKVVICGDDEQLQSVGAGAVLRDMINSEVLPITRLKRIYRQAQGSNIYENSHRIREGITELLYGDDFHFGQVNDTKELENEMVKIYLEKIKQYGIENVMLLSPFKEHDAGVHNLNTRIQNILNPQSKALEFKHGSLLLRVGDKVMQLKNDVQNNVMNGDMGVIISIKKVDDEIVAYAAFANGSKEYTKDNAEEICLAYAYTIHKAQGSEAKCVIIGVHEMHSVMLRRNVFYTGITRAKEEVCLVGQKEALIKAIETEDKSKRNTILKLMIRFEMGEFIPL